MAIQTIYLLLGQARQITEFFLPFFRGYTVVKGDIPPIPTVGAINIHTIRDNPV